MELFIRIKDGQPFEHPIFGDNFRAAFPNIDINNLPPEFSRFERVEQPTIGVYEIYMGVTYKQANGIVRDVHHIRPMTEQEKQAAQDAVKAVWAENGFVSWTFDEKTCSFKPPVPYPEDDKPYRWDEGTTSWVERETV